MRNIDSSDDLKIVNSNPSNLLALVGKDPESALDDPVLKDKFKMLLGESLGAFTERLNVSSGIKQEGGWVIGEGAIPHLFSIEEAAFAINVNSGEIAATMLVGGKDVRAFGVNNPEKLPPPLLAWFRERAGQ